MDNILDLISEDRYMELAYPPCSKRRLKKARNLLKMVRHKCLGHYDSPSQTISNAYRSHTDHQSAEDITLTYMQLCGFDRCEGNDLIYGDENTHFVATCPETGNHESQKALQCQQDRCNCWKTACYEWLQSKKG